MHRRNAIDARHDVQAFAQRHELRSIGADIAEIGAAQAEEFSVCVERELGDHRQVAAMEIADETFGAVAVPLHRAPDAPRRPGQQGVFGKEAVARAEISAHVAAHRAALLFGHVQHRGQDLPLAHHAAAGASMDGVQSGRAVVIADRRARLHGHAGDALDPGLQAHDMRRARERRIGQRLIADVAIGAQIAGTAVPDQRRICFERVAGPHHHRERFIVDRHQLRRIPCSAVRLGDHHADRLADIADLVGRKRRHVHGEHLEAGSYPQRDIGRPGHGGVVRDRSAAIGEIVGAGEDGDDTRHRARLGRIDRLDAGVRVGGANDCRKCHVRQRDIRKIAAPSGEEPPILLARDGLTNTEFNHPCDILASICVSNSVRPTLMITSTRIAA